MRRRETGLVNKEGVPLGVLQRDSLRVGSVFRDLKYMLRRMAC